ncbi:gliding motility-associated C-terminal domain-containing protein [Flavobacterium panacagri]|uniref:T9SS type B sorting domain-containing protein n=1 Tax=Flavobacterium panacagri TaxID=3034146 RepID=UPI0025A5B34D|nr:gliding motility-associated C-terminal domain-containing protein [Flavobacterium panacagri]
MKKIYSQCFAVFYFLLILVIGSNKGNAQVIKPFKERTSSYSPTRTIYKIKGDFTMIGNTNLTLQDYAVNKNNGPNAMVYVDTDNDNQTHNSSAATLDLLNDSGAKLTNCYNIVYAGLYWTGRVSDANISPDSFLVTKNNVTKTLDKRKILFKGPTNSAYSEFTAAEIYFPTNADNNIYTAYAEVTDYVRTNGVGEYFAANIASTEGADGGDIGKFAGWGLVVVYENSNMKNRDITVFDGHAFVSNNIVANHTIPVSGFNSAMSGTVGVKLGVMAGEGDVGYEGDYFQIQKLNTSDYMFLSHSENSTNNFFNSTINTGGNNRNPSLVNNTGLDISMFYLPNENKDIIGNNQTSTTFKYGSTVDSYAIFSIVMAVDAYVPEIEGVLTATTINGNNAGSGPYTVLPGQELGYKVQIKNRGNEAIQNSKIVIPIPYNTTFVGGSLAKTVNFSPLPTPDALTYEPTIGANGSIVWDIGTLPLPANPDTVLGELTFTLKSTGNCALLKNSNCGNSIQVNGVLSGQGANSGVTVADKSLILGYTNSGSCTGTSITAPLQTTIDSANYTSVNCQATPPTITFTFCNGSSTIPVTDIMGSFPNGSTFYNAYPVVAGTTVQYTINTPFPATVGTSTYYAIPPGGASGGCYFEFTITIESITTMPTVSGPVDYCIGDTASPLTAVATKPEYTLYYYQTLNSTAQQSITPSTLTAGQFTYYVAEGKTNACIGPKKEIVVNVNTKPALIINNPLPICAPASTLDLTDASITAGSTSGLTYTYWTDAGATTPLTNFSAVIPGTYYIKGTNTSNCYEIKPVIVTKSTVTVTEVIASHVDVNCFNQSTGSITVNNASGGVAPYSYYWKKNGSIYTGTSQTLTNLGFGNYEVTATDANGCQGTLTIAILQPNSGLVLTDSSKTDVSCFGGNNGSATVTVSGGTPGYTYSWNTNPVQTTATASNLTSGNYTVTITDANGCSLSESFTIMDGDSIVPIINPLPAATTISCPAEPVFTQATASDNNGSISSLTYMDTTTPGNCAGSYTVTRTWTAKDACGNISLPVSQTINVQDNSAPTWTTLAGALDKTIKCSDTAALTNAQTLFPTASDTCDTDVANIVKVSGQFIASTGCSNTGTYTNTWTVTDDCGNVSDTFTQVITIQDTEAPIFSGNLPQNSTISCDAVPQPAEMTASDDCTVDLPIVFSEIKSDIQNGCTSNYTLTRTWKTSDCAGNTVSYTQVITVRDTTPPTGTAPANVINLASADLIPAGSPADIKDAADNCSPKVNITVTDTNSGCDGNVSILTRTYTLTDCAGNKTELVQTFSVNCKVKKAIIANDDTAGPIAGINHTTTNVLNIFSNDTLDGVKISPSDVILTTVTPNDYLHLNPDGSVDVLPNAPIGTLTLVYQICEAAQTDNCDTATVTITIEAPKMTVAATAVCVNDVPYIDYVVTPLNFTPVNAVTISWADNSNTIITTMADLPLSGRVLWPGAVVDSNGKGIDWPGWIFENNKWIQGPDGFEKLRPTVNLVISLNPTETITVNYPPADPYCTARPTFTIIANDDSPAAISVPATATNIINVFTNDTLNNTAVNPADVTLTTVTPDPKGILTLNTDGSVTVAANTPVGTYTLTYQICEKADAGNCDTAIVIVIIQDAPAPPTPVIANDDNYNNIGCNTFGVVGNVLSNDVKGAVPATLQLIDFTLITQNNDKTNPNITIDNAGNVNVSSLTPAGTYIYSYRICDKLSSQNCDTATVTIVVVPNGVTQISSTACTDDSSLINLTTLLPEGSPITGTWVDKNNTNALQGSVLNPFGLALGNYAFEYLIADEKCPRSIVLNMEVNDDCKVLACGDVLPRNAFSPNGDGMNDTFKIDNIDDVTCYPGNTVEIYNRWGILVFETVNYNNTSNAFDGTSRGRTTIKQSDGLPTGTYFYIINYKSLDGSNTIQENKLDGYLYLSR